MNEKDHTRNEKREEHARGLRRVPQVINFSVRGLRKVAPVYSLLPVITFGVKRLIVFKHYVINFNCLSSLRLCLHLCRVWRCIQCLDKTKTKCVLKSTLVITDGRLLLVKSRVYFASHRLKHQKKKTTTEQKLTSLKSFSSFVIICSFLFSLASSSPVLNSMWWIFCL